MQNSIEQPPKGCANELKELASLALYSHAPDRQDSDNPWPFQGGRLRVWLVDDQAAVNRQELERKNLFEALDDLGKRARSTSAATEREIIFANVDELRRDAESRDWPDAASVMTKIAGVYASLEAYESAIELLDQASVAEVGDAAVQALERQAEYRIRMGARDGDKTQINTAIRDLNQLMRTHEVTASRLALVGLGHKRILQFQRGRQRLAEGVLRMTEAYFSAAELRSADWHNAAINVLLGVVVLGGPWDRAPKKRPADSQMWRSVAWARHSAFGDALDDVEASLRQRKEQQVWDAIAMAEVGLLRSVADESAGHTDELVQRFNSLINQYGAGFEIESVRSQWAFMADLAEKLGEKTRAGTLRSLLADALGDVAEAQS